MSQLSLKCSQICCFMGIPLSAHLSQDNLCPHQGRNWDNFCPYLGCNWDSSCPRTTQVSGTNCDQAGKGGGVNRTTWDNLDNCDNCDQGGGNEDNFLHTRQECPSSPPPPNVDKYATSWKSHCQHNLGPKTTFVYIREVIGTTFVPEELLSALGG